MSRSNFLLHHSFKMDADHRGTYFVGHEIQIAAAHNFSNSQKKIYIYNAEEKYISPRSKFIGFALRFQLYIFLFARQKRIYITLRKKKKHTSN